MRRALLFSLCFSLLVVSCDATLITIDVPYETTTTVEAGTVLENLIGEVGFGDFLNMDVTSSQELQNQGVAPGDINAVSLTYFRLTAAEPDGADLSFLESLEFYAEAPDLPRVLVASASDFPAGQATVDLDVADVDLTDYVVSQSMTLSTEVEGRRPDDATDIFAELNLSIAVTGQGACNFIEGGSAN